MQDFRKLRVWQAGFELTLEIYRVSKQFPKEEAYGITSQIRRACSSIIFNIAEGCGKSSAKEMNRYLQISMGSASEVECQLLLVRELNYLSEEQFEPLNAKLIIIKKQLNSLISKLKTKNEKRSALITKSEAR